MLFLLFVLTLSESCRWLSVTKSVSLILPLPGDEFEEAFPAPLDYGFSWYVSCSHACNTSVLAANWSMQGVRNATGSHDGPLVNPMIYVCSTHASTKVELILRSISDNLSGVVIIIVFLCSLFSLILFIVDVFLICFCYDKQIVDNCSRDLDCYCCCHCCDRRRYGRV